MNRPQNELLDLFEENGGEEYLNARFGEPEMTQFGFRRETGDYHKTVKVWFSGDEVMARVLFYLNPSHAEDQIVIRQYLGDYCD